jgi:hypothetical protein
LESIDQNIISPYNDPSLGSLSEPQLELFALFMPNPHKSVQDLGLQLSESLQQAVTTITDKLTHQMAATTSASDQPIIIGISLISVSFFLDTL